jgi:hypothetical protein
MNVILENLTDKPLWAQLNSGTSVHIGPRLRSLPLPDNEVKGNPKLARLTSEQIIRVLEAHDLAHDTSKKSKEPDALRGADKARK